MGSIIKPAALSFALTVHCMFICSFSVPVSIKPRLWNPSSMTRELKSPTSKEHTQSIDEMTLISPSLGVYGRITTPYYTMSTLVPFPTQSNCWTKKTNVIILADKHRVQTYREQQVDFPQSSWNLARKCVQHQSAWYDRSLNC